MKVRYWLAFLGITLLSLPASAVRVTVDGKPLAMSPKPVIRGRRVYVPVDAFSRIGLWVKWKPGSRHAEVGWPDTDFIIDFSVNRVWIEPLGPDDRRETLPGRPFARGGKLMIPLRAMVDGNQLTAEWNPGTGEVALHRERHWLKWRTENDMRLRKEWPDKYATPI
jgi:hypothetical protein